MKYLFSKIKKKSSEGLKILHAFSVTLKRKTSWGNVAKGSHSSWVWSPSSCQELPLPKFGTHLFSQVSTKSLFFYAEFCWMAINRLMSKQAVHINSRRKVIPIYRYLNVCVCACVCVSNMTKPKTLKKLLPIMDMRNVLKCRDWNKSNFIFRLSVVILFKICNKNYKKKIKSQILFKSND